MLAAAAATGAACRGPGTKFKCCWRPHATATATPTARAFLAPRTMATKSSKVLKWAGVAQKLASKIGLSQWHLNRYGLILTQVVESYMSQWHGDPACCNGVACTSHTNCIQWRYPLINHRPAKLLCLGTHNGSHFLGVSTLPLSWNGWGHGNEVARRLHLAR